METLLQKRLELFIGGLVLFMSLTTILITPWPNAAKSLHRTREQSQANLFDLRNQSNLRHRVEELTP